MKLEDYSKYYIQGSEHYLLPKDVFDELFSEMSNWREEVKELKKQLEDTNEELELVTCDLHNRTFERDGYYRNIEKLENQQKKFIEYLTHELNTSYKNSSRYYYFSLILSKYKEIIGVSNEY